MLGRAHPSALPGDIILDLPLCIIVQVAASAGLGLPRGVARPCPHCGACNAEGDR